MEMSSTGQPVVTTYYSRDIVGLTVEVDLNGIGLRDHRMAPGRAIIEMTPDEMIDMATDLLALARNA